jgi:hypothetical protein
LSELQPIDLSTIPDCGFADLVESEKSHEALVKRLRFHGVLTIGLFSSIAACLAFMPDPFKAFGAFFILFMMTGIETMAGIASVATLAKAIIDLTRVSHRLGDGNTSAHALALHEGSVRAAATAWNMGLSAMKGAVKSISSATPEFEHRRMKAEIDKLESTRDDILREIGRLDANNRSLSAHDPA